MFEPITPARARRGGQRLESRSETLNAAGGHATNSKMISLRGYLLAQAGQEDAARRILATLEAAARERYLPPYAMALIHAGLGDRDSVYSWLDRAYELRDVHLVFLSVDPKWEPFRRDPRFVQLLERCAFIRRC